VRALPETLSSAGGATLATATGVLAAARRARKPLHPRGDLVAGVVRRTGSQTPAGVPWLDEPGEDQVLVRLSRAVGLPSGFPDIHGLALRVPLPDGRRADLLLASTGLGRATRFVLTASRSPQGRPLTTLLPYRAPRGPVVLGARPAREGSYDLLWSAPGGTWHPFGELVLTAAAGADPDVSFDPLLNTLPGLENYEWVRRLREPAYATARRTSGR
jgi:hypothetical protein